MASISKTTNGYRAQIYVRGRRDSATFRTRREAVAWAAAKEAELREHEQKPEGERTTLAQVMRRYADEVSVTKRGARWEQVRLERFMRDPELPSSLPVSHVTPQHVAAWRDARRKAVAAGSVLREMGLLSAVFEHARREWQMVVENPVKEVRKPPSPDHREVIIQPWQIRRMLRALGYSVRGRVTEVRQAVAVCFLLALRSGMRAGELCGMTWDRVHDDHVTTPHKTGKTAQSLRAVPLEPRACWLIERMRGYDEALVFGVSTQTLDALFRKYRQRAGLDGFTFHDARHTAATRIARKVDVLTLCKIFGWAQTKQALTYYNPSASSIAAMLARRE